MGKLSVTGQVEQQGELFNRPSACPTTEAPDSLTLPVGQPTLGAYAEEQDARRMAAAVGGHARRRPHDEGLTDSEAAELCARPWGVYAKGEPRPWVECLLSGAAPILNASDARQHLEAAHGTELDPRRALAALLGMAVDVVSDSEVTA